MLVLLIIIVFMAAFLVFCYFNANKAMMHKAEEARICYENLKKETGINPKSNVVFNVNNKRAVKMVSACFKDNPFPRVKVVLCYLRLKAVIRLFKKEKVKQTGPASAVLALNAAEADEIFEIRNESKNENPVVCDVAFAGLQVIRLYMMAYQGNDTFINERCTSGMRVNNALNGSFYKYKTLDSRYFSAHVYYESQKEKLMNALKFEKSPKNFTMNTLKEDKKNTASKVKAYKGLQLEELAFNSGACGCMLRDRCEWEASEVGKAVCNMPLFRLLKVSDAPVKNYGRSGKKGPLSGVKVLDLTHIIAGPACTRILAELGADVLLVRRGKFEKQEQAMLELDGWAGKHSIQLDFNVPSELKRAKELVKEADVIVSSYQYGVFDKFGLSCHDIHKLNPNVIYGSLMCFSDSVWRERPGWAPLAEDITGLSIRNGSRLKPKNLNGVPLDYIPGFILASGILKAIKLTLLYGGAYNVTGSLTRTAYWLHECTDICHKKEFSELDSEIKEGLDYKIWEEVLKEVFNNAVGTVKFPSPATYQKGQADQIQNMNFTDGNKTWKN